MIYGGFFGNRVTPDIRKFINLNRKYWADIKGSQKKGYILVDGLKSSAAYLVVASRAVKSIEENTGCLPIVLANAFSFSWGFWKKVYESYNINNFLYLKNYYWRAVFVFRALILSLDFYMKKRNVSDLLKLEFEGVYVGDLIYDNILRFNKGLYTIEKIKWNYFGYIFSAFLRVMICKEIFNKYNIKYVYVCLPVFIKGGILVRIADQKGAIVVLASRKLMKSYEGLDIMEGKYRPRKLDVEALRQKDQLYKDIDAYFNKRFSGEVNEIDVLKSYKGKIEYNKDVLCERLGLDKSKPIVFIMPHAFSDGPHHTPIEKLLFRDFYVWLVETIKCVSEITNINWIMKPHPMSFKYNEEGEVKRLVDLYGKNNIKICPDDLNTKSIKDIADVILTVQGKSGLEFGCFGIPAIVTSQASYSGFGFTIEPRTVEEYFNLLKNISAIPKLNEDQIKTAKVLSAIMFLYSRTNDPMFPPEEDILYFRYNEKARWKQNCLLMEKYYRTRDEFYLRVKDLLDLNLYKKYLN